MVMGRPLLVPTLFAGWMVRRPACSCSPLRRSRVNGCCWFEPRQLGTLPCQPKARYRKVFGVANFLYRKERFIMQLRRKSDCRLAIRQLSQIAYSRAILLRIGQSHSTTQLASGVVESSIRRITNLRLKSNAMFWRQELATRECRDYDASSRSRNH